MLPSVVGVTCQGSVGAAGGAKVANGQLLLSAPYSHDLGGYGQNGRENLAVWTYRLNDTNTGTDSIRTVNISICRCVCDFRSFILMLTGAGMAGPDPEPALVARIYPCKAAYSSFSEDGMLNLFEGGPDMRYQSIMLATLNHSFPSPN